MIVPGFWLLAVALPTGRSAAASPQVRTVTMERQRMSLLAARDGTTILSRPNCVCQPVRSGHSGQQSVVPHKDHGPYDPREPLRREVYDPDLPSGRAGVGVTRPDS